MTDKFDQKLNMDTATPTAIAETNEKLVSYMNEQGETVAAEQIENLIQNQRADKDKSKPDPNSFALLTVNKKILSTLEKIYRDMIDEQDTSIKHASKGIKTASLGQLPAGIEDAGAGTGDESSGGFGLGGLGALGALGLGRNKLHAGAAKKEQAKKKKTSKAKPKRKMPARDPKTGRFIKKASGMGKLAKGALRFAKFAGPLGAVIGAGMAISDGIDGYNNAGENLGIDEENITTANKASSAAGSAISGLTFGLADAGETSKGINNLTGGNPIIEKYENMGIIDHDTIGNSEITSWSRLVKLKETEIQEIIKIDDWSDEDMAKLRMIRTQKAAEERVPTDESAKKAPPEKISYQMKQVPTVPNADGTSSSSLNPDDYKSSELFNFYKVNDKDIEGLEPNTLSNLKAMGAEYLDTFGEKIQINSAFRSFAEQAELKEKFGSRAAAPGASMHNYGVAIDMNTVNANKAISAGLFNKYGFTRPVPGETWHVEPVGLDRAGIRASGKKAIKDSIPSNMPSTQLAEGETSTKDMSVNAAKAKVKAVSIANIGKQIGDIGDEVAAEAQSKGTDIKAEVNKTVKEIIIDNASSKITTASAQANKVDAQQVAQLVQPVMMNNINSTPEQKNEKLLAAFSV